MNDLLVTGHIAFWVLALGLFVPRLTLVIAWLVGAYPANDLPNLVNLAGWFFLPRFLMAYYIYTDIGSHNIWFWAYLITGIAGLFGESGYVRRRVVRRRVVRDGNTVTTIEEEEV